MIQNLPSHLHTSRAAGDPPASAAPPTLIAPRPVRIPVRFASLTIANPALTLISREATLREALSAADPFPDNAALRNWDRSVDGFLVRSAPISNGEAAPHGWRHHEQPAFDRHYCDVRGRWDAYVSHFSKKSLYNLKRNVRRLSEATPDPVEFLNFSGRAEIDAFCDLAAVVSDKTYQARLYGSRFPAGPAHRASIQSTADADACFGHVLRFGERPVAFAYFTVVDRALQLEYLGYDPEFGRWSVGMALLWTCMERHFNADRWDLIDFGEGDAEYKRLLSTGSVRCANRYLVRHRMRPALVLGAAAASVKASRRFVGLLDRLGAKERLRRLLRQGRR